MGAFALPILASLLVIIVLISIFVSVRNPPVFWMDERRVLDRLGRTRDRKWTAGPPAEAKSAVNMPHRRR
jgi:hypothetical protein